MPNQAKFQVKTVLRASLVLLCLSSNAAGGEPQTMAAEIVRKAKSECANYKGGKFNTTEQTITQHDLTGDGQPEEIVDASQFACSTSVSMWGGAGGALLWVLVNQVKHEFLAHKWRVVDVEGEQVLLLAVHSSECSDTIGPCYRALVWSDDGFRTIR